MNDRLHRARTRTSARGVACGTEVAVAQGMDTHTMLWNDSTRETRYAAIVNALEGGCTVLVMTARGAIKVTAKNAAKWKAAGRPVFKLAKGSIFIASGKRYDCIDYNHLQIVTPS